MADRRPPATEVTRAAVLAHRLARQGLATDADGTGDPGRLELLDHGIQDSGPDGAAWAVKIRGAPVERADDLVTAWTLRGAPHVYRRSDVRDIATATAPCSEADAASRVYDASKPLAAAGIPVLDALTTIAGAMREIVQQDLVKGELSTALTARLDEPYLRTCRPCDATHAFEMPFRLAALQAGLELVPGTSPPVLRRIRGMEPPMYARLGGDAPPRYDVIRGYLRFFGPARVADAAKYLDAPIREVTARWPTDVVEVRVAGEAAGPRAKPRFALAGDLDELADASGPPRGTRLLGPFDPYLQLRDRALLVEDEARRKDVWRTLGRPGGLLHAGEIRGTWRPSTKGRRLTVAVTAWEALSTRVRAAVEAEAERLADHRGVTLAGVDWS